MATYYIDNVGGCDGCDGLTPEAAKKDYLKISVKPGDTLLFKRGSFYRGVIHFTGGEDGAPTTYGAYGDGEMPTFCGSVDVSAESDWELTEVANVWRCTVDIPTDVGNFVFNDDECTATLRWAKNELCGQGDFWDSRLAECNQNVNKTYTPQEILLFSCGNPATVYRHIEAVPYGARWLGELRSNLIVENLEFMNSGVHGLTCAGYNRNITIRGCVLKNIGGCGWSRERRIRFGNGIEFWIGAENILIENNKFLNIYDSCATHQGPDHKTPPARNFHVHGNIFDTYSMAAFEYRAQMMIDSSFTDNICRNAGCGFGMLGEELPRMSEIHPQPMGHHIFLWRIWEAPEGGSLLIEGNRFENAPHGAAVYSIICPEAEAQVALRNNLYTGNDTLLVRWGEKNYPSLDEYKSATGNDEGSEYIKI